MDNNLRIRLSATLNSGKAIKDINDAIKGLQNHPSLRKIDLKLNIDKNFTQSINQFISAANKLKKVSDEQNKVVSETINVYKELDGSIRKVTTTHKANGEVITKTRIEHSKNSEEMRKESQTARTLASDMANLAEQQKRSLQVSRDAQGNMTSAALSVDLGKSNSVTNKYDGDGNFVGSTELEAYEKQRKLIDQAHIQALKENKARQVAHNAEMEKVYLKDLENYRRVEREKAKVEDLMRRFGSDSSVKEQLSGVMSDLNRQSDQFKKTLTEGWNIKDSDLQSFVNMDTQLKNITASAKTARSNSMSLTEQLGEAFKKFPIWMIATTAFYGSIRALSSAVNTIVEIDSKMTELRRVMADSTDFDKMLSNSIDLSNQLGRSLTDTLDAMGAFAKQGFNEMESENLAETALLMQNISDMTSDEAVNALTSAMISFNIEASKSIDIADKINQVDNDFSVTSQTLAVALQRAGSASATFGVSLEETLGHVTAIGAVTRESGSVIGNSLKSIYSRITTMDESAAILDSVGVSVRDMGGNIREVGDILNDLAGKWTSLTDEQQQNIGVTVAGRYQLARFLALLNNYQMALDATETATHAQGSATRENAKYMDSLQARIEKMKVSWQSLAVSMGENGITDILKGLIQIATSVGNTLETLVSKFGAVPTILFTVGAAITLLSSKVRKLVLSAGQASIGMVGLGDATKTSAIGMRVAAGAASTLKVALRSLLVSTGVGIAVAGLGFVVEKVIGLFDNASDSTDNLTDSMSDLNTKVEDITYLKELGTKFEELAKKQNKTTEESMELANVQSTLESKYNISTTAIEGQTEAIENSTKAIQNKIAIMEEEISSEQRIAQAKFYSQETERREAVANAKAEKESLEKRLNQARNTYNQFLDDIQNGRAIKNNTGGTNLVRYSGLLNDYLDPQNEEMKQGIQRIKEELSKEILGLEQSFSDANNSFIQHSNEDAQAIQATLQGYISVMKSKGKEISPVAQSLVTSLATLDAQNNLSITQEQFEKLFDTIKAADVQSLDDISTILKSFFPDVDFSGELGNIASGLAKLGYNGADATDELDGLSNSISGTTAVSDELVSEIKELNQILYNLAQGESLTAEEMYNLIKKYPQLQDQIKKTADGYTIEKSAIEAVRTEKLNQVNSSMSAEKSNTDTTVANIKARCVAYGIEIENIKTLAEAKNKLIAGINKANKDIGTAEKAMSLGTSSYGGIGFDNKSGYEWAVKQVVNQKTQDIEGMNGVISDIDKYYATQKELESKLNNIGGTGGNVNDLLSDPMFGVSSKSGSGKSGSGSSGSKSAAQKAAEEAQKKAEDAYQKDVARFKYLAEMQNWSTQDQIDGWNRIEKRHKAFLVTSVEDQRSLNLELKKLREQRFSDDMDALDKRVEKMRINNATEVQMEQEKLRTYQAIAKKSDLTADQRTELNSKIFDTKESIAKGRLQETNDYLAKRNKIVEEYNQLINVSEKRQALLNEASDEYNEETIIQNTLRQKMISFYQEEIAWIKNRLKANDLTKDQMDALIAQQKEYEEAILDTAKSQRDAASAIADDVIDKITKAYEEAKEAALSFIEDQMDAEDERHNQAIENIEKEQNAFNEAIDNQIKALQRQKDEESYDKQLKKKQEEQAKIQADINKLMLDDSVEAKKKREDLEQQLNDKIEEINEFQNDRQYELREQALNDAKELNDKQVDAAKETENAINKINKDALEKRKKDEEAYWNSILDNDEYFTALREDIISGNLENLSGYFGIFRTEVEDHLAGVGEAIETSIIDKINKAQDLLGGLGYTSIFAPASSGNQSNVATFTDPFGVGMSKSDFDKYLHNKYLYEIVGDRGNSMIENSNIRKKYGITVDKYSYQQLKDMAQAKDGGMTPSWGSQGKLMMVHENELILNKADTSVLLKLFDFTKGLFNNVGSKFTSPTPIGSTSNGGDSYYLEMNIDKITGDKEGVDYFFSEVRKGLKKMGK